MIRHDVTPVPYLLEVHDNHFRIVSEQSVRIEPREQLPEPLQPLPSRQLPHLRFKVRVRVKHLRRIHNNDFRTNMPLEPDSLERWQQ